MNVSQKALICLLGGLAFTATLTAAEVTPPASQRFADADTAEAPDFQKHVVPLLGRLGCNGRNCHGSFQGRGGFRLSLFGYDFKMDHAALTAKSSSGEGPRVNRQSPDKSLAILKPSLQVDHEGGDRFEVDSWEHHVLQRWIASGAKGISEPPNYGDWKSNRKKWFLIRQLHVGRSLRDRQRESERLACMCNCASSPSGRTTAGKTSRRCVDFAPTMTPSSRWTATDRSNLRVRATVTSSRFMTMAWPRSR